MVRVFALIASVMICFSFANDIVAQDDSTGSQRSSLESRIEAGSLIDESDHLDSDQRHFLQPLSAIELTRLFDDDEEKPGVPKIGIVRHLTAPITLGRRILDGKAKTADATSVTGGRLSLRDDGVTVWTTSISSPGAENLRLRFDHLELPDNAKVFVYAGEERYGPYTREFVAKVTKGVHPFWTNTVQGPVVFVEVQFDDAVSELDLSIDAVGHFESSSPENLIPSPEGTECFVDVSCATDDADLVKALSTAAAQLRYAEGGSFYVCTGSLVNVSATPEFEPYLLTANHCFKTQASASSLEAWWDYRTSTCGGTGPSKSTLPKVLGSTLLASDDTSDFTFVELTSKPAGSPHADGGRFYLGWNANRDDVPAETRLYRASHPSGGLQVWSRTISFSAQNYCSALPPTRFIYSAGSVGGTKGGSSGASASIASGQIVGQNYGKCGTDLDDPCDYAGANTVDGAFATTFPYIEQWLKPSSGNLPCALDDSTICLQSNRFEVQLSAKDPRSGRTDSGYVMDSADYFGYYAFPVIASNQTDPQIFVKVIDGRPFNNKWWVFYASLTDVEFTLTVRDTQTGATKTYRQEPYTQESKNDTSAFD